MLYIRVKQTFVIFLKQFQSALKSYLIIATNTILLGSFSPHWNVQLERPVIETCFTVGFPIIILPKIKKNWFRWMSCMDGMDLHCL